MDEQGKENQVEQPIAEQIVDFYGDNIPVAHLADAEIYVPLHPVTDFLGLIFGPQRRRILRDNVMHGGVKNVYMRGFIQDTRQRLSEAEAELQQTNGRLDASDTRLTTIELQLDPAAQITDEQAAEIALSVKTIGHALEAKGANAGYVKSTASYTASTALAPTRTCRMPSMMRCWHG